MEIKLLSDRVKHEIVPENYILPFEQRPDIHASTCKQVPIINLAGENQVNVSNQIISAGKDFGFFQVIDHGISEQLISDVMEVAKEFFDMPMEYKAVYYSEDFNKAPRLYTSRGYNNQEKQLWRDCLRLVYYGPGDEFMHLYPQKPTTFRDIIVKFVAEVEGLATRILKLMSQGLGLGEDYFSKNLLSEGAKRLNINHYPPCPDPSLTLGIAQHCDPGLMTLLLQGNVSGLQVLHCGEWVQVDPIPNAFVVNFGHLLEITTNGLLKSVEHRAVTNATVARTSIATFIMPTEDCHITPAQALIHEHQLYKSFSFTDFFRTFLANQGDRERTVKAFMCES